MLIRPLVNPLHNRGRVIRDYLPELTPACHDLIEQTKNPDAASNLFSTLVRVIQHRLSQHLETQHYAKEQQVDYLHSITDDALPTYARNISDELFGRMRTIFTKILDRHFAPVKTLPVSEEEESGDPSGPTD